MITAVDTNILIDIFIDDKQFGEASASVLKRCLDDGAAVISGVVLVETMVLFPSREECLATLATLNIRPVTISMETYLSAASIWKTHKQANSKRGRIVADFLIGAHALIECDRLLTRDRGFYRQCFKKLAVIEPNRNYPDEKISSLMTKRVYPD